MAQFEQLDWGIGMRGDLGLVGLGGQEVGERGSTGLVIGGQVDLTEG